MIARRHIADAVDSANEIFQECWNTLVALKERRIDDDAGPALLRFQFRLASVLFALDDVYRAVCAERDATVTRKGSLTESYFRDRMQRLGAFQTVLVDAIHIGKTLGDTFAWPFYLRSERFLQKHLQHAGNLHTPPGIGGQGELAFIRNVRLFPDHILIYHGTTTFLRLGDVSFIHLPTMTLSGIAELKTRKVEPDMLETSAFMLGIDDLPKRLPFDDIAERGPRVRLPPASEQRLRRQLTRIGQAFQATPPDKRLALQNDSHLHHLNELLGQLRTGKLISKKVDDGLTIAAARYGRRDTPLSSRLMPRSEADLSKLLGASPKIAMEIIDQSGSGNSLLIDQVGLSFLPGMTPLFWSPIAAERLRPLLFHEAMVFTFLNPLHLVRKLRARGFEVETGPKGFPTQVASSINGRTHVVKQIESFAPFLQQHLFTEDTVISMIEHLCESVDRADLPSHVRAVLNLKQFYGRPPEAEES